MVWLKFIPRQRLTDITSMHVAGGASLLFAKSMSNANRLRESLKLYSKVNHLLFLCMNPSYHSRNASPPRCRPTPGFWRTSTRSCFQPISTCSGPSRQL